MQKPAPLQLAVGTAPAAAIDAGAARASGPFKTGIVGIGVAGGKEVNLKTGW
ncbi:MAG: hypothetical protein QGH73_13070 [Rhodospirillales bacterium]|jgi:hypothetical protein|nr:hypothetical protein [Rhodospirillales bacterium]MDP6645374.1 hypothetical protein [Rhodospirillales bacterium]MDP6842602.1 hypothetical protein [Rhodospirillales bacterium]|tara:strand:+ start:4003 stop:4158 length:156 start_codon:yes stop_codon:yes gene_type:complete